MVQLVLAQLEQLELAQLVLVRQVLVLVPVRLERPEQLALEQLVPVLGLGLDYLQVILLENPG